METPSVDHDHTGDRPAQGARRNVIALEIVKLPQAKRGIALLPRR